LVSVRQRPFSDRRCVLPTSVAFHALAALASPGRRIGLLGTVLV
jgi:hypothetical protein